MYYFILHLSIADLLTAFFTVIPEIVWTATYEFYGGNGVCKIVKFGQERATPTHSSNSSTFLPFNKVHTYIELFQAFFFIKFLSLLKVAFDYIFTLAL